MTDLTDQDRRVAHEWAASIDPDMKCWSDRERVAARVILDTVDAPAPTLAEELREFAKWVENPIWRETKAKVESMADRAEQIERECDEARADLSTVTRQRDEARQRNDDLMLGCEGRDAAEWMTEWEQACADAGDKEREAQYLSRMVSELTSRNATLALQRDEARAEVERLTDLPEPTIWEQGKYPQWGNAPYSTKVIDHPFGGLMVRNPYMEWGTPQQAREEAYALLAAADYVEENQ